MTKEEKQKIQEIQMIVKRTNFVGSRGDRAVRINKRNGMRFLLARETKTREQSNGN